MLETVFLYSITCAGLSFLLNHCLSPLGIFWGLTKVIAKLFEMDFRTEMVVPNMLDVLENQIQPTENMKIQLTDDELWEKVTSKKSIFFAFGLCPMCFGFWLSILLGTIAAISTNFFMVLPFVVGTSHLIIKLSNNGD